jgi:hypothetical protein
VFFPDVLYRFSQQPAGSLLQRYFRTSTSTSAAATITETRVLSDIDDRWLILQTVTLVAVPGAGQQVSRRRVMITSPAGDASAITLELNGEGDSGGAGEARYVHWTGSIVIPPLWRLQAISGFNAAANPNAVTLNVFGIVIPRGTLTP